MESKKYGEYICTKSIVLIGEQCFRKGESYYLCNDFKSKKDYFIDDCGDRYFVTERAINENFTKI